MRRSMWNNVEEKYGLEPVDTSPKQMVDLPPAVPTSLKYIDFP